MTAVGRAGVWVSPRSVAGEEAVAEAAQVAERLGYDAFWLGGSPAVTDLRPALEATERIVVASGILNVWQHTPADVGAAHLELTAAHPGRLLLGIGIGHPEATSDYKRPLGTMRDFFDGLDAAGVPRDERIAAALGPKMLDLAGERSLGTHPYFTTPGHTRVARERLGPDALIAPEVACVVDTDVERARTTARKYAHLYLNLRNYTRNLLDTGGFTESDLADGGSDALIDAVVPHGPAQDIAVALRAHYDAGADHVCVQPVGSRGIPRDEWAALIAAAG